MEDATIPLFKPNITKLNDGQSPYLILAEQVFSVLYMLSFYYTTNSFAMSLSSPSGLLVGA